MTTKRPKLITTAEELENSPWGRLAADPKVREQLPKRLNAFIKRIGGDSPIAARAIEALDLLTKHIIDPYANKRNLIILGAAILYTIFPIDAIPDVIPVVGWLDDIGLLAIAIGMLRPSGASSEKTEAGAADAATAAPAPNIEEEILERIASQCSSLPTQSCDSLQQKLTKVRAEVAKLKDEQLQARMDELEATALDPMRRVMVTSAFSAGKSSIINRLLDDKCLPSSMIPTTPVLTTLMYGEQLRCIVNGKDNSYEVLEDTADIRNVKSEVMKNARELLIHHPSPILANGFSIVDTPGIQHAYQIPLDKLPRSEAFLFVTSAKVGSWTAEEAAFLEKIASKGLMSQLILVLNKMDLVPSAEALDAVVEEKLNALQELGLTKVPVYRLSERDCERDELSALREELLRRAQGSMQAEYERSVDEAADGLLELTERLRMRREERARLDAQKRAEAEHIFSEMKLRTEETVDKHIDMLKTGTKASLHTLLYGTLLPELEHLIDTTPLTPGTPGKLTACIRESIELWVKAQCKSISDSIDGELDTALRNSLTTQAEELNIRMPESIFTELAQYTHYLLPGLALITFFPMGIFAWLTTIAIPTYILDKFGVDKGIKKLLETLGASVLRTQLKEQLGGTLMAKLERSVAAKMEEILNTTGEKVKAARVKALEAAL